MDAPRTDHHTHHDAGGSRGTGPPLFVNLVSVTRQSIVKIRELFRTERILERTAVVDLERIGINLISVIRLEVDRGLSKDISR